MRLKRHQLRQIIINETKRILRQRSRQQIHERRIDSYSGFSGPLTQQEPEPERREKAIPGERFGMIREYTDSDIRRLYADLYAGGFGNQLSGKIINDVMKHNVGSSAAAHVASKILIGIYESLAKGLIEPVGDTINTANELLKDLAMGLSYNLAFNGHISAPRRMITDADVDEIYKLYGGRMTRAQNV